MNKFEQVNTGEVLGLNQFMIPLLNDLDNLALIIRSRSDHELRPLMTEGEIENLEGLITQLKNLGDIKAGHMPELVSIFSSLTVVFEGFGKTSSTTFQDEIAVLIQLNETLSNVDFVLEDIIESEKNISGTGNPDLLKAVEKFKFAIDSATAKVEKRENGFDKKKPETPEVS